MRKSKILAAMLALAVTATSVLSVPSLLSAATDNSIRMEAETDGDFNNYADLEGNVVGGSSNSPYTMAEIKENGLDKSVTSYVEYTVEAPESGEYDVTVGGIIGRKNSISFSFFLFSAPRVWDGPSMRRFIITMCRPAGRRVRLPLRLS